MGASPPTHQRVIAATELLLIAPAALFMTALVVRGLQQLTSEPAHSAQRIVTWFAVRPWTLGLLLMALPAWVLVVGLATLLRTWQGDPELRRAARRTLAEVRARLTLLLLAAATLAAAGVLAVVAVHALAD